ncbi:MAG: hypothetical protein C0461_05475 [Brevundimonas sp.]|nr:hypothetical protein [Brevundimonas sp.]
MAVSRAWTDNQRMASPARPVRMARAARRQARAIIQPRSGAASSSVAPISLMTDEPRARLRQSGTCARKKKRAAPFGAALIV